MEAVPICSVGLEKYATKTIETTKTITPDHMATLQLPDDVSLCRYHVILVLEEQTPDKKRRAPLAFPIDHYGP